VVQILQELGFLITILEGQKSYLFENKQSASIHEMELKTLDYSYHF
jgi:hypothetical protein